MPVIEIPTSQTAQIAEPAAQDMPVAAGEAGSPDTVRTPDRAVGLLAGMMFLAPAIGVPYEEMLQDTLKSMVISFAVLAAAVLFFWQRRKPQQILERGPHWHALMWFPLALTAYALGSMAWAHTYLAGVEAVRWFVFSLLLWVGLNTFSRNRLPELAWCIHLGAIVASTWTALQFWNDLNWFPQGAVPASTFINRNFFAEYVVCTLPFSAWLLARSQSFPRIAGLAYTLGLNIVALLMTGTRSALVAMWLLVFLVLPLIAFLFRKRLAFSAWSPARCAAALGILLITIISLGMVPTENPRIKAEQRGNTALERAILRTASIPSDEATGTVSARFAMWHATGRMIQDHPLGGVGAGSWEVQAPLYQSAGLQLETDYYPHNEILQLLSEYGVVGWITLIGLLSWLARAAWRTFIHREAVDIDGDDGHDGDGGESAIRAVALASLLALLVVSNAGFPWHLASTGALFAICLAILAASDIRTADPGSKSMSGVRRLAWRPEFSRMSIVVVLACTALAAHIARQAAASERKIIGAAKLALTISSSRDPQQLRWTRQKSQMLKLIREGIAINPHYRKLTPLVADELARWGDWKSAVWIWESVIASRPHVVAILSNIARGYAQLGDLPKAFELLARCKQLQPSAPGVRSLEVGLLSQTGRPEEALSLARQSLNEDIYDFDLLQAAWTLGTTHGDDDVAIKAMEIRNMKWPPGRVDGLLKLGDLYARKKKDDARALSSYRAALAATPESAREATRGQIPAEFLSRL
jgi:O-antigen ligase